jgi:hypothetical protein
MALVIFVVVCSVGCISIISVRFKRTHGEKPRRRSRRLDTRANKRREALQFFLVLRKKHAAQASLGGRFKARH